MSPIRRRSHAPTSVTATLSSSLPTDTRTASPRHSPFFSLPSDSVILAALTAVAAVTRFYALSHPKAVVFDEFHFFRFLRHHLQRQFVFDIHPWLGKLTHFVVASVFRVSPEPSFDIRVGAPYYNNDYVISRFTSALFGVFCVPLMYLIARELTLSRPVSFLAAFMPLCDNLLLMESRYVLLDSQLITYINLTLLCALRLWRYTRVEYASPRYYRALLYTAVSAALAMSVKWTAAVTPFLIALVCAFGVSFLDKPIPLLDSMLAAVVALGTYLIPWFVYLRISINSTPYATHMSDAFRHTLRGNQTFPYRPDHNVTFLQSVFELHWRQFRANQNVRTRHPWESRWYEWPTNARGLLLFLDKAPGYTDQNPLVQALYLIQNPAGALWVSMAVVTSILLLLVLQRYRTLVSPKHRIFKSAVTARFLCAGYILNLVPYMFVERCYFNYHYLPALTYGQLLLAVLVDVLPRPVRYPALFLIISTTSAAFVYWSPWIYGTTITFGFHRQLQWMPRWS
ncbi:unnamed protein product [Agarophyton chilense]